MDLGADHGLRMFVYRTPSAPTRGGAWVERLVKVTIICNNTERNRSTRSKIGWPDTEAPRSRLAAFIRVDVFVCASTRKLSSSSRPIAARLGISRARVSVLTSSPGFSRPLGRLGRSDVWRWSSVERWARETGRLAPAE